jgi:hypothetical protein
MLRKLLPFMALPMVLSCAPFQQAAADNGLAPEQSSLIDATCTNVMGLRKGEAYFADCQDSLTHSMVRKVSAEIMAVADNTCRDRGLAEGSAAKSVCMLDEESRAISQRTTTPVQPVSLAYASGPLESGKSYYGVTPTVRWHRERYSCAQLGLMPNSALFGECVASLEGELLPDN